MIDAGAAATGVCDAVAGAVGSVKGSASLRGGQAVRNSVNGAAGQPRGFATLELDGSAAPTLTTPTVLSVVFLGDSTADRGGPMLGEWVYRLSRLWADRYDDSFAYTQSFNAPDGLTTGYWSEGLIKLGTSNRLVQIWNPSKGGLSFDDIVDYPDDTFLDDYIVDRNPDILVLALGINQYTEVAQMALDMQTLIDDVAAALPDAQIVVSSENPIAGNSGAPDARDAVRAVAAANGFLFVDAYQAFIDYGDWESLLSDGTHPTPAGSQLWADFWNRRTALGVSTIELVRNSAPGQRPRVDSTVKTAAATATKKEASIS